MISYPFRYCGASNIALSFSLLPFASPSLSSSRQVCTATLSLPPSLPPLPPSLLPFLISVEQLDHRPVGGDTKDVGLHVKIEHFPQLLWEGGSEGVREGGGADVSHMNRDENIECNV